jgi:hypothetical protein
MTYLISSAAFTLGWMLGRIIHNHFSYQHETDDHD